MMVALLGQAMPGFWFGLVMIVLLGLELQWLPISGVDTWQGYIMPGIVLAFSAIPALMRLTRSGMIDALAADYIRTARAKGLSRPKIILKHALRNAAMPVVSIAAVQLGFMLGGSVVIESVLALPGVGYLAWESIIKNDFPVVQAVVLFLAVIFAGGHDECTARPKAARMSVVIAQARPSRRRLPAFRHLAMLLWCRCLPMRSDRPPRTRRDHRFSCKRDRCRRSGAFRECGVKD